LGRSETSFASPRSSFRRLWTRSEGCGGGCGSFQEGDSAGGSTGPQFERDPSLETSTVTVWGSRWTSRGGVTRLRLEASHASCSSRELGRVTTGQLL
ncbi:unnamed protein product, partial [Polarella glacialis]